MKETKTIDSAGRSKSQDAPLSEDPSEQPEVGMIDPKSILIRGRAVLKAESEAIEAAGFHLGPEFVGAVKAILTCSGRVCVTGMGKAGLIGGKIQATFASTGSPAYAMHPVEALHGDLGMVRPDDVVVALSKSGTSELAELLPRLAALGTKIILLTAKTDSPAAGHADFVLNIGQTEEACPLGLAPSSSTAAMLALGDALALTVMHLKDVQPDEYASYHPGGALGRYLQKAGEVMRTGENCPFVRETATLGDCYEVILKAPRRAGAAAVVDEQDKLVGILTHGDFFRLFRSKEVAVDQPVSEVMTRSPKCVDVNKRVPEALEVMKTYAIDELPVVDKEGRLAGLLDIQDLIDRGY